jgi:adenine phosphoribosyltransferase
MSSTGQKGTTLLAEAGKAQWLKDKIRDIPDFPKPGIVFKDMTTLMKDAEAFGCVVDLMAHKCAELDAQYIAGIEARGFILATAIAYKLKRGFIPVRKPNKLPHIVEKVTYDLEYGTDSLEIHVDAVEKGDRVVVVDDLLATGGTAAASCQLLERVGANVVGVGFVVELGFLGGRKKLPDTDVFSVLSY